MEVHILESANIYKNLAMENALLMALPKNSRRLLMWSNDPAIVMGRFQNPWVECNLSKMSEDGVSLARRQSGGGTVYHDRGNLNISFMDWNDSYDKEKNNEIILAALASHGLSAFTSGRSDILLDEDGVHKKISGAAFKKKKDRSFHHCTMLLDANLELLNEYLASKIDQENLQSKAIASVRSKVANIKIKQEDFISSMIKAYETFYGQEAKVFTWDDAQIKKTLDSDPEYLESLVQWKWVYGETPFFETSLQGDNWEISLSAKKGIIRSFEAQNSLLHPSFCEQLGKECLVGLELQGDLISSRIRAFGQEQAYGQETIGELKSLDAILNSYFAGLVIGNGQAL